MQEALEDKPEGFFTPPEGVVFVKIDLKTGLQVDPDDPGAFEEVFVVGTEPTDFSKEKPEFNPDEFYRVDEN